MLIHCIYSRLLNQKNNPKHMKKLFNLFIAIMALIMAGNAQNVCTVNTTNTKFGITPNDTTAPAVIRGAVFDTVAQIYVPDTFTINVGISVSITIDSVTIDTVTGFPQGITYTTNPGASKPYMVGDGHVSEFRVQQLTR